MRGLDFLYLNYIHFIDYKRKGKKRGNLGISSRETYFQKLKKEKKDLRFGVKGEFLICWFMYCDYYTKVSLSLFLCFHLFIY